MSLRLWKILGLVVLLLTGCAREETVFNEVKHPHELLKVAELNTYLEIVHELPNRSLPPLPPLFAQLPNWDLDRELSVKGLVKEEQRQNQNRWFTDSVLAKLSTNRPLERLLKKHDLSLKQFLGLSETICMAAARTHFDDLSELRRITRTGQHEINELLKRDDVFCNLPVEDQFELLHRAAWITRLSRAENLLRVPEENVALLKKHAEHMRPYLPVEVLTDPLREVADHLKQYGLPFEELSESGSDAQLRWSPEDPAARIGHATEKQLATQPLPSPTRTATTPPTQNTSAQKTSESSGGPQ